MVSDAESLTLRDSAEQQSAHPSDPSTQVSFVYRGKLAQIKIWLSHAKGHGTHGTAFEADMLIDAAATRVIVKAFPMLLTRQQAELFKREVSAWETLDHPRILPYYGNCEFGFMQHGLVSPYMENGNMIQYLARNPSGDRARLLHQVAEGLHYLHVDAGIVHGDLKCANVLISPDCCALLADFSLSTFIERTESPTDTTVRRLRTVPFAAPELLLDRAYDNTLSTAEGGNRPVRSKTTYSDCYAFGMLVYEAFTGSPPWTGLHEARIADLVVSGERPPRSGGALDAAHFSDALWNLCSMCWDKDISRRPTATAILATLAELVGESGCIAGGE